MFPSSLLILLILSSLSCFWLGQGSVCLLCLLCLLREQVLDSLIFCLFVSSSSIPSLVIVVVFVISCLLLGLHLVCSYFFFQILSYITCHFFLFFLIFFKCRHLDAYNFASGWCSVCPTGLPVVCFHLHLVP